MHRNKMYIEAFTLLETLFVILLTTIVVSLVFVYFNAFQRYMLHVNNTTRYETDVLRFETLMQWDLDRARKIVMSEGDYDEIECVGIGIFYEIGQKYIVRFQDDIPDTLKGKSIIFTPLFYKSSDNLLTGFEIEMEDFNDRIRGYSFYKQYDEKINFEEFKKSD